MEWLQASCNEEVELITDLEALRKRFDCLDFTTTSHHLYSKDAPQQLMAGVSAYAGADMVVPDPPRRTDQPVSLETYQQQRAVEAMNCIIAGGFVLHIFNRTYYNGDIKE
jgi:hypothetical protein